MPIDPAKAKAKTTFAHPGTLYALAYDRVTGRLFAGGDDNVVHVYDPASAKKESLHRWARHDNYVSALTHLPRPDKALLISGGYDRLLVWWDAATGEVIRTAEGHAGWVRDLAALPDGARFASVGDDMLVKLWDAGSGKLLRTYEGHATRTPQGHVTALYAVAVAPDGRHLASGDRHGVVRVWETETGKLAQTFEVPILYTYDPRQRKRSIGGIRSLAFSPDGASLAVGGIGQVGNVDGLAGPAHVEVWDWKKPALRVALAAQGHKALVNLLLFHPAGWLLGAGGGGDGGLLAFWKTDPLPEPAKDKKDAVPVQRYKIDGHVHGAALKPGGEELYLAGHRKLEVWTLA